MRKSVSNIIKIVFFILFFKIQITPAQNFGALPFRECWQRATENMTRFPVASDNANNLYLSLSEGVVEAVEKNTGNAAWRTEIGGEIISPLVFDEKKIYVVSKNVIDNENKARVNPTVHALSISTGVPLWQRSISLKETAYLADDYKNLYVIADSGIFYSLNKETGNVIFEKNLGFEITSTPFMLRKKLYFATAKKRIISLSIENGQVLNTLEVKSDPTVIVADGNDTLFVGDKLGKVSAFQISNKRLFWKAWTGAEIISINRVSGGLLVTSFDNYVYLLSEKNGKRIWKRRLAGRSAGKPLIKDNVAVFSIFGSSSVLFLELSKGKTINQISVQTDVYFLSNPVLSGDLIVFSTHRGVSAFTSEKCVNEK